MCIPWMKFVTVLSPVPFEDLYIGDYFDKSITTSLGGTETVRLILAGFDLVLE